MITGKDLIELGYKPGKWFKEAIAYANENGLEGRALVVYLDLIAPKPIEPFEVPVRYHINIEAEDKSELSNLDSVLATMNEVMRTPTVTDGAIMPDACPTGEKGQIPVGSVIVTKNAIHPGMHSADVCCSVMMSNFGFISPKEVLDIAQQTTHFGRGGREEVIKLPESFIDKMSHNYFLNNETSKHFATSHFGTQGDGNHFLFVGQSQNSGETVLITHHGSRGLGAHLYKEGMKVAEHYRNQFSPLTRKNNAWIPFDTEEGKAYWEALQLVREWTKLNHAIIHDTVAHKLNTEIKKRVWNEHNFVFRDGDLFYHAKGATPLADKFVPDSTDGLRLIPLNMSEPVLVVRGESTHNNLGFAPHGAGRNMSRSEHKRKHAGRKIEEVFQEETKGLDIRFFSGNIDISELPSAYKSAENVKQQMQKFNLGNVVDEIIPYGSIMAGEWRAQSAKKKNPNK